MGARLGLQARLYRNTGTYAVPVWEAVNNVKDLTLNLEKGEADVSTRNSNGWRATIGTLKEGSVEFQMVWDRRKDGSWLAITTCDQKHPVHMVLKFDEETTEKLVSGKYTLFQGAERCVDLKNGIKTDPDLPKLVLHLHLLWDIFPEFIRPAFFPFGEPNKDTVYEWLLFVIGIHADEAERRWQSREFTEAGTGVFRVKDQRGVVFEFFGTVATLRFIRQNNSVIPLDGDEGCHMVSKFVTDVNLPETASFDGPAVEGTVADPDTFRIQIAGLPQDETPQFRLDVLRSGQLLTDENVPHFYEAAHKEVSGLSSFRSAQHVRLVSNKPPDDPEPFVVFDDEERSHQTVLVKLGDIVRATLVLKGQDVVSTELPVGRPTYENGLNAIRTVDVNYISFTAATQGPLASNPQRVIDRLDRDWAQAGIRFRLKSVSVKDPVNNAFKLVDKRQPGDPNAGPERKISIKFKNRPLVEVTFNNLDSVEGIASKIANAVSALNGIVAKPCNNTFDQVSSLVAVKMDGEIKNIDPELELQPTSTDPELSIATVTFGYLANITDEAMNLTGFNFKDSFQGVADPTVIHVISTGTTLRNNAVGVASTTEFRTNAPGKFMTVALAKGCDRGDISNTGTIHVVGHEVCHILTNENHPLAGPPVEANTKTNLFFRRVDELADLLGETLGASKRLTLRQQQKTREVGNPEVAPGNTIPGLLRKE